jgi:hypothetical protein
VDFFEATDLFVNIFRISDLSENFTDRGLISENPRGLSAKLAKSGPRVDFTKVQGPLCKISKQKAAPVRQSSPVGAQNGEGSEGTRLGSHRSSGGTVEAGRRWCRMGRRRRSVRSSCGLGSERLRAR